MAKGKKSTKKEVSVNNKTKITKNMKVNKITQPQIELGVIKAQIAEPTENGITFKDQDWKFGLLKQNRPIKNAQVQSFLEIISKDKYKKTESIKTIKAIDLKDEIEITDLDGQPILSESRKDYLIVLDGQHRITAFAKINATINKTTVPHVYIEKIENVGEYLADLNLASRSWTTADKVCVSSIATGSLILKKVNDLIKDGFNASTAYLIYTRKKLSQSEINKILKNNDISSLPKEDKAIERAEHFLVACQCTGIKNNTLTKRYYIEGFNSYASSLSDTKAFNALEKINLNDFKDIKSGDDFATILKEAAKRK